MLGYIKRISCQEKTPLITFNPIGIHEEMHRRYLDQVMLGIISRSPEVWFSKSVVSLEYQWQFGLSQRNILLMEEIRHREIHSIFPKGFMCSRWLAVLFQNPWTVWQPFCISCTYKYLICICIERESLRFILDQAFCQYKVDTFFKMRWFGSHVFLENPSSR